MENKKKKLLIAFCMIAIFLSIFVSCSDKIGELGGNGEATAYVSFNNSKTRSLEPSYEMTGFDELYWYYTAEKLDDFGSSGETTEQTAVNNDNTSGLAGKVGPFSQGAWKFTLYAYSESGANEENLVYQGVNSNVILKGGDNTVTVTVQPQGNTGTLSLKDAYFSWKNSSDTGATGKPTIKLTLKGTTGAEYIINITVSDRNDEGRFVLNLGDLIVGTPEGVTTSSIPTSTYTCVVEAYIGEYSENSVVAKNEFSLNIFGNGKTVISGDLLETPDAMVDFKGESSVNDQVATEVFESQTSSTVTVNAAPAEEKTTAVDFGSNNLGDGTHQLIVEVSSGQKSASKFEGVSEKEAEDFTAVANIDMSLYTTTDGEQGPTTSQVETFNEEITIITYIQPGLGEDIVSNSKIRLVYVDAAGNIIENGAQAGDVTYNHEIVSYDNETGELKFTTNHFSSFYVTTQSVVRNETHDRWYTDLQTAISDATDGDEIKLIGDILYTGTNAEGKGTGIPIKGKSITLDLAGHMITVPEDYISESGVLIVKDDGKLTIEDSSMEKTGTIDVSTGAPVYSCIVVYPDNAGGEIESLIINGGTFKSDAFPIAGNAHLGLKSDTYIEINDGNFISAMGPALFHPQVGTLKISGGNFEGETGVEIRGGDVTISDGTFIAKGKFETYPESAEDGNTVNGAAIAVSQHTYKPEINLTISGGSFSGKQALYEKNIVENEPSSSINLSVTGGKFSGTISTQNCLAFASGGAYSYISDRYIAAGYLTRENSDGDDEVVPFRVVFDETFDSGSGTESDPYIISTTSQLKMISEQNSDEVFYKLGNDITNTVSITINEGAIVHLEKDGHNLTFKSGNMYRFNVKGSLKITGEGTVTSNGQYGVFQVYAGGALVVDGGKYVNNSWYSILAEGDDVASSIEFKSGELESTGPCIQIEGRANITIEDGSFTSTDNAVIFVFGGDEFTPYPYELTVNGGSFYGSTETAGWIACGINMGNSGKVILNGGSFNITDGVGILARCGTLIANKDAAFNCTGDSVGQVGDSKVQIKAGCEIVVDTQSNYPGGQPSVENNGGYNLYNVDGSAYALQN